LQKSTFTLKYITHCTIVVSPFLGEFKEKNSENSLSFF